MSGAHDGRTLGEIELPAGRGYLAEGVERFRAEALGLVADLEARVSQLNEAVDALREELGSQDSGPGLTELLRAADPAIVRAQSSVAAGEILALAVDAADRHRARATAEVRSARLQTVELLREVADLAREGRRPSYELHRLVLAVSTLIARLEAVED